MAVSAGVDAEGGEKVDAGPGAGVEVGMRATTCPQAASKRSADTTPMAIRAGLLATS